eukprot:TCALIF_13320-PA protein Name:"Protein of unknown function" AED:0.88 eAED:0.88 QI:0/0/0/0.5/0/0.5/2/0/65
MSTWLTIWVLMLGFGTVELSLTSQNNTRSGKGGAIGDCTTDTFSVTAPESVSSPVICGFNTGQHS